jgi:hypothetical protein
MKAQVARLAIGLLFAALAVSALLWLGWTWWIVPVAIFVIGGTVAEWAFRKLATAEVVRGDLEDRVRNPPL